MKKNIKTFLLLFVCYLIITLFLELTYNPNQLICDNIGNINNYNKKLKELDENLTRIRYLLIYNGQCKEVNEKEEKFLQKMYDTIIIKWENSNNLTKLNSAYNYIYYGLKDINRSNNILQKIKKLKEKG